jgi:hypothetical protein
MNRLLKNDQFEETNFLNEVLDNPDLILSLKITKLIKEKNTVSRKSFPIANAAVSDARKSIKT